MKLYYFLPSNNSRRVHAVALHLNLPIEFEPINLQAGEHQTPEFLALNPTGRVPVLQADDFVLWESNAIAQYLAAQITNSLWPDSSKIRAAITSWQCWQLAHLSKGTQPLQYERFVKKVLQLGEPDERVVQQATNIFHKEATVLDQQPAEL